MNDSLRESIYILQQFMEAEAQAFSVQNDILLLNALPMGSPMHARIMADVLRKRDQGTTSGEETPTIRSVAAEGHRVVEGSVVEGNDTVLDMSQNGPRLSDNSSGINSEFH